MFDWHGAEERPPVFGTYEVIDRKGNQYETYYFPTTGGFDHKMHYEITHWRLA